MMLKPRRLHFAVNCLLVTAYDRRRRKPRCPRGLFVLWPAAPRTAGVIRRLLLPLGAARIPANTQPISVFACVWGGQPGQGLRLVLQADVGVFHRHPDVGVAS